MIKVTDKVAGVAQIIDVVNVIGDTQSDGEDFRDRMVCMTG